MHQFRFRLGLCPRSLYREGESRAHSAPQTLYLDFSGPTSKGREGRGWVGSGKEKGCDRNERVEGNWKGRGKGK